MSDTSAAAIPAGVAHAHIQPTPLTHLQDKYNKNQKPSRINKGTGKGAKVLTECTSDTGLINSISKLAKNVFTYPKELDCGEAFGNIVKYCDGISNLFKVLGIFKAVKELHENINQKDLEGSALHQRNLKIASASLQVLISGSGFVKLLDTFGAIKIAEITAAMGSSSVVGSALAAALPFTVVTNVFEIAKNIVDLANASIRVHENRMKHKDLRGKARLFNADPNKGGDVGLFIDNRLASIEAKQQVAKDGLDDLEKEIDATKDRIEKRETDYQAKKDALEAKSGFQKIYSKLFEVRSAKNRLFSVKQKHDAFCAKHEKLLNKLEAREEKKETWEALKEEFDPNVGVQDDTNLKNLIDAKQRQWKVHRNVLNFKNRREAVGMAINILVIITLIAATVFFFTGTTGVLGITSMFLIVSILGLGSALHKKYRPEKRVTKVNVNQFAPAPAA